MWRSAVFILETGILKPRNIALGQFPRKLRASRFLLSENCIAPVQCPEPCGGSLMDQIPVPDRPWQEKFDENTKESTKVLMIAAGVFLTTLIAMHSMGPVPGYDVSLF